VVLSLKMITMKYDVITFGSATLDVFVQSPDFRIIQSGRSITGSLLALPYGIKAEVTRMELASGGGGTNTAVGLARLGLKTAVVARFGWDIAGKVVRNELKKEKVGEEFLCQFEGEATDWSTVLLGPDGGRTILVWRGPTRLERSLISLPKLNSFWFYIASLEGNIELLEELVEYAENNHIKVALNPGKQEMDEKSRLLAVARKTDVFIVNREEAAGLTGYRKETEKVFGELSLQLPGPVLVVTAGTEGLTARVGKQRVVKMKAHQVKMVNQLGAGDAFGSGLVAGLAKGWETEKALRLGLANGAAVVSKVGAKAGLIKEKEIDFWINE
jgi:ribokinase